MSAPCTACGFEFIATTCTDCTAHRARVAALTGPVTTKHGKRHGRPAESAGEHLAGRVVDYRLAIEQARHALRIGRISEAAEALDAVAEPRRRSA